jgi:hypothetical protein
MNRWICVSRRGVVSFVTARNIGSAYCVWRARLIEYGIIQAGEDPKDDLVSILPDIS